MADFEAPVPLEETPEPADPMAALMALSREQQRRRDEALARLRGLAQQQGAQAQGLRTMSLLTSMGQNPLLQGLQREASGQGAQLQGMASQAEARADVAGRGGVDPLGLARLQQLAEYQKGQQELGQKRLTQQAEQAAAKAQAAKDKAAAGAAATEEKKAQSLADKIQKFETGLRKEIFGSDVGKDYLNSKTSFRSVEGYVSNPSPATDMALVFAVMKTLDPTSVVKEGEQEQVRNTTNIPGKVLNYLERAKSGEGFSPAQRMELQQMAAISLQAKARTLKEVSDAYAPIAASGGADMRRVNPFAIPEATTPVSTKRTPAYQAMPTGPGGSILLGPTPAPTRGGGDFVKVVSPDGKPGRIPRANLEKAKAKGYKEVL